MKNWFYSKEERVSKKNPGLRLVRSFGSWEVRVGDTIQTGPYTNAMWKDAFRRTAKMRPVNVHTGLLLGLGGGGAVKPFFIRFPGGKLLAVEFDPAMVEVANEIGLYKPFPLPEVTLGDVREIVPKLTERYDLIVLDVFEGKKLSSAVEDRVFLSALKERLNDGGTLIVNFSGYRSAARSVSEVFKEGTLWKFRANTLGAFW